MNKLLSKLATEYFIDKSEIEILLNNNEINSDLFHLANEIRKQHVGDEVHLRGLIEFSNVCQNDCLYCGLRCLNKTVNRYKIPKEQIVEYAKNAKKTGLKTVVLQSGEATNYTLNEMLFVIKEIKKLDLAVTLSIGEKTFEEYLAYKNAGADRYLLRIETTDKKLYKKMHPNMNFDNRVQCLKNLKKLNYEVGSGFLVGLPNQTLSSIADDLLFLKEFNVDMAGIGPFIPTQNTPLENAKAGDFTLALKVMAIMRLLLPDINIPATTAMETLNPNGQFIALQCGANVIMPNVTPPIYKEKYLIYQGKAGQNEDTENVLTKIKNELKNINRSISKSYGSSKSFRG